MVRLHQTFYAVALFCAVSGCGADANQCDTDNDCPGGVCVSTAVSRECRPLGGGDLSVAGMQDAGGFTDGPPILYDALEGDAIAASCTLNMNGVVERAEAP